MAAVQSKACRKNCINTHKSSLLLKKCKDSKFVSSLKLDALFCLPSLYSCCCSNLKKWYPKSFTSPNESFPPPIFPCTGISLSSSEFWFEQLLCIFLVAAEECSDSQNKYVWLKSASSSDYPHWWDVSLLSNQLEFLL